jgi:hypothetical protein
MKLTKALRLVCRSIASVSFTAISKPYHVSPSVCRVFIRSLRANCRTAWSFLREFKRWLYPQGTLARQGARKRRNGVVMLHYPPTPATNIIIGPTPTTTSSTSAASLARISHKNRRSDAPDLERAAPSWPRPVDARRSQSAFLVTCSGATNARPSTCMRGSTARGDMENRIVSLEVV